MKARVISILLFAIPTLCFGRLMKLWTYQELSDQADLVVIAVPTSSSDTKEVGGLPGWETVEARGVETVFSVRLVMKGDKTVKSFVLHHYRLKEPDRVQENAPDFVSFKPPFDPKRSKRFLLFLKREADGRYAPVSGQLDPALFDVVKLDGEAR